MSHLKVYGIYHSVHSSYGPSRKETLPRGYKTLFILNSTEHEVYHAHKCWLFNIYKHDKYSIWELESKKVLSFQHYIFYEQLKFHAQLSWAWNFFITGLIL